MDVLNSLPWGALSPAAVLLLTVILILRGDLIPRRTVERELSGRDTRIVQLEKAGDIKDQHIATQGETLRALTHELSPTVAKVMRELQSKSREGAGHEQQP